MADRPEEMKRLWQTQATDTAKLSVDELRRRSDKLERKIFWRNAREYGACALVVASFSFLYRDQRGARLLPGLLMVLGTLYIMFQLWRKGSAHAMPADMGLRDCLAFHRGQLERQRDLLRRIWLWNLLPLAPGIVAIAIVQAIDRGVTTRLLIGVVVVAVAFLVVGEWNRRAAVRIQRCIDELSQMEKTDE